MLKDRLNLAIKPAIHVQAQAVKNMVTWKMVTMINTQTANQDRIHDALRQNIIRLHNQMQDLIRELRSTAAARTPPT